MSRYQVNMSSTILVVEDEPAIQELIAVNLSFAGHKVLRASDASQAEILISAELPDLILLDYYPTTPLSSANLPWHILFGVSGGHVHSTIAHGQVLMRNRELLTMDEAAITARSREVAKQTWERYWAMF